MFQNTFHQIELKIGGFSERFIPEGVTSEGLIPEGVMSVHQSLDTDEIATEVQEVINCCMFKSTKNEKI